MLDANSMDPQPSSVDNIAIKDDQDVAIEDLAARICLDDEADTVSASKEADKAVTSPNRTIVAEEIAKIAPRYVCRFTFLPGNVA